MASVDADTLAIGIAGLSAAASAVVGLHESVGGRPR
jgi:hypothetical protein